MILPDNGATRLTGAFTSATGCGGGGGKGGADEPTTDVNAPDCGENGVVPRFGRGADEIASADV